MAIIYEMEFSNGNKVIRDDVTSKADKTNQNYYVEFKNGEQIKITKTMCDKIKIHFNEQFQNSYEDMVSLFQSLGYEINPKLESTNFGKDSNINDHDTLKIYQNKGNGKFYVNWFAGIGRCQMPHQMDPVSLIRFVGPNSHGKLKDIVISEEMVERDEELRKYLRPLEWSETFAHIIADYYDKEQLEQVLNTKITIKESTKIIQKDSNEHLNPKTQIKTHQSLASQISNKISTNTFKNAFAYLKQTRRIHDEIINKLINDKLIYQSFNINNEKPTANVMFIGYSNLGLISSVFERGVSVNSSFKRNYAGLHNHFGWFYDPENPPMKMQEDCYYKKMPPQIDKEKFLLVFEGSIDMLSYMSFLKLNGHSINNYCYLSCGSITNINCVKETCKIYGFRNVCVFFDNDLDKDFNAGQEAAKKAIDMLEKEFDDIYVISRLPGFSPEHKNYKDWNECLVDNTIIKNNKVVLLEQPEQNKTKKKNEQCL